MYVQERADKAVSNADVVLSSTCNRVQVPGEIEKALLTAVEALRSSCKPVYVRERPDKEVLTGAVKYIPACLSGRKNPEISFYHCEGPVKLVQAYVFVLE